MAKAKRRTKIDDWAEDLHCRLIQAGREITQRNASLNRSASTADLPLDPAVELEARRQDLEGGDQLALLDAIAICAKHGLPMPAWASQAFLAAHDRVVNQERDGWKDVFGTPLKRSQYLLKKRKRTRDFAQVMVSLMLAREEGRPIGTDLFDEIGDKFGLSKTVVSDIYYGRPKRKNTLPKQASAEFRSRAKNLRYKKR